MGTTSMETDEIPTPTDLIGKANTVLSDKISEDVPKNLIFDKYRVVKDSLKTLLEAHVSMKTENDSLKARMDKLELAIQNQTNTKVQPSRPSVSDKSKSQKTNSSLKQPLIKNLTASTQGNRSTASQNLQDDGDDSDDDEAIFLPKDPEVRKTLTRYERKLLNGPAKTKDAKSVPSTSVPQKKKARQNLVFDTSTRKNGPVDDITLAN
ncbi:unnamed protein product [Bemisia tabaci]|uniref:Uncharacterized protein n=1 Tax=Bemisia tabaci TaxID=7038 RepID=A0A9P0F191_BEMTA|nr:unnamed protein product [Bemisia tabaci]